MESSVSVTYVESAAMSQRKKTVIDILRDSHDFVSGEAISDVLGISRNAVHKHVKSLRKRGYRIVGVSRRGYRLEDEPARLSMGHVTQRTENTMFGHSFRYHDEIESTNVEAKTLAIKGAPEGTVVVAEAQTAGRGRLGRRWTSPAGKGLLFSVILRPSLPMSEAHLLTIVAATAAAEAIEKHVPGPRRHQVAQRPLHRRPQGRRHPDGGLRRAGRGRLGRPRHRPQREHRVQRAAGRAAPHGDVAEDGRRRDWWTAATCSPACC